MNQRTLTCDYDGAVTLDLNISHGHVQVVVDDRDRAELTLTGPDGHDSPAINDATASSEPGCWTVRVPAGADGSGSGVTVVNQSGHTRITGGLPSGTHIMQVNGATTIIHGAVGTVINGSNISVHGGGAGPTVQARLPRGSSLHVATETADVETGGLPLASVQARSVSGDLRFGSVDDLTGRTVSGDMSAAEVGGANLRSVSGDIRVRATGGPVRAKSVSGDVAIG